MKEWRADPMEQAKLRVKTEEWLDENPARDEEALGEVVYTLFEDREAARRLAARLAAVEAELTQAKDGYVEAMAWMHREQTRAQEARAERDEARAWGQQIHDALDGKPLPEHPDEAPARVAALRAERDDLADFIQREYKPTRARLQELRAERDEARDALRPYMKQHAIQVSIEECQCAHCLRARAVLARSTETEQT